jgi:hypothetical protein
MKILAWQDFKGVTSFANLAFRDSLAICYDIQTPDRRISLKKDAHVSITTRSCFGIYWIVLDDGGLRCPQFQES